MKFLGMGLPELIILLVLALPIIVAVVAVRVARKRKLKEGKLAEQAGGLAGGGVRPALDGWKTSVGFSILGATVGYFLYMLACAILSLVVALPLCSLPWPSPFFDDISLAAATVIAMGGQIFYALKVYPSYFTEKPLLKNRNTISLLNLELGGIIFGCLWNGNLTRRVKGESYVVATAFSVVNILFALVLCAVAMTPGSAIYDPSYSGAGRTSSSQFTQSSSAKKSDMVQYKNDTLGVSVRIPRSWEVSEDPESGLVSFCFDENYDELAMISKPEMPEGMTMDMITEGYVDAMLAQAGATERSISTATVGSHEYIRAKAVIVGDEGDEPVSVAQYIRTDGEALYFISFMSFLPDSSFGEFELFVASLSYTGEE